MTNTNDNTSPRKVFKGYYGGINKHNPSLILPLEQIEEMLLHKKTAKAEHYVIWFLLLKYATENKNPTIEELIAATGMKSRNIKEAIAFWFDGYLLPALPNDGIEVIFFQGDDGLIEIYRNFSDSSKSENLLDFDVI